MQIGFLGLGEMGRRMAGRLLGAGHGLTVWNRSPGPIAALEAAGARVAATPAEAARGADAVVAMVSDDDAASRVWCAADGALAALPDHAIAIDCSTLSPDGAGRLADAARAAGRAFVAAPVSGSLPQAESGELVILAGGADAAIDRARPALAAMGSRIVAFPSAQAALQAKLAVNSLLAIQIAAVAELRRALAAAGADVDATMAPLLETAVASPAMRAANASMASGDFAPRFPVALMAKDMRYAAAAFARPDGAPIVAQVRAIYEAAAATGLAPQHMTAIVRRD